MAPTTLPSFDDLPLDKEGPPGNAWGLWGKEDQLGRLNLITPETVASAASEVQKGIRVSLDWPLNSPIAPFFGRQRFDHKLLPFPSRTINDDVVCFNTQCSTQWDGFRHYGYQRAKKFFNGKTKADFESSTVNSIDIWAEKGGIIGRGVLLDWATWAEAQGFEINPFQSGAVELRHLKQIVKEKEISFKQGDILFIPVGFTAAYRKLSVEQRENFPDRESPGFLGLEATKDSLRWLWETGFAAVASDCSSFERGPTLGPYNEPDVSIHQWGLAGWGMPLGEIFDLEELAVQCQTFNWSTFFLTSVPLKVMLATVSLCELAEGMVILRSWAESQAHQTLSPSFDGYQLVTDTTTALPYVEL